MIKIKSDYLKGLLFFLGAVLCFTAFIIVPDGDNLFYKFIGLFGIGPGIKLSANSTLYIYMAIPLVILIVSIKKVFKYWQGYGLKFKDYNRFLRWLPLVFIIITVLFSVNVNNLYFTVISQRGGLRSVIYYDDAVFRGSFSNEIQTYSYDLSFENMSGEIIEFKVKLTPRSLTPDYLKEIIIKDDTGEDKIFMLMPNHISYYTGEFTADSAGYTDISFSSSVGAYTVVLMSGDEEYIPKPVNPDLKYRNRGWRILPTHIYNN